MTAELLCNVYGFINICQNTKVFMGVIKTEFKVADLSRDNGREVFLIESIPFNFSMKIKVVSEQIRNNANI